MPEQSPRSMVSSGVGTLTPGKPKIQEFTFMRPQKICAALKIACLVLMLGLVGQAVAGAQGLLLPRRHEVRRQPFYAKNLKINAVIRDAVAETTVEQTFVNTGSVEMEATYLYPIPEGATPTSFSMTVGDKTLEPRLLSHDEARQTYENIVRTRRDPALLEYVGRNLLQVSVYPIPAQGERTITLRYSEILKAENGLRKFAYASSTARFGAKAVGTATARIEIKTTAALKNVYSPTHDLSIHRPDDHTAVASWESNNDASDHDLTLYYSTSDDDVGLSLLTYHTGEKDGYFMLLASPRVSVPKARILPKQVVFVLDRTGSMQGDKIKQARKSLLYCLDSLRPEDRFGLITFNESPDLFTPKMLPATDENIKRAKAFVADIEAAGGTNIDAALGSALSLIKTETGTQKMIVFLTDGLPTIGETNIETILKHVAAQNAPIVERAEAKQDGVQTVGFHQRVGATRAPARIFCFGLGFDVNVPFLDRLANVGRGDADYVKPEEDVEAKVSNFFAKIESPVLSDLRVAFNGAEIYDVFPKTYPDLFKGSQLVVTGRFRGAGAGSVRLTGLTNNAQEHFQLAADFSGEANHAGYVPRIWAARKIGYLADQLRLSEHPENMKEVSEEIVRLSQQYGIITEYTSFLVDDGVTGRPGVGAGIRFRSATGALRLDYGGAEVQRRANANGIGGLKATDQSLRAKDLQSADKLASRYQSASGGVVGQYKANGPSGPAGVIAAKPAAGNYRNDSGASLGAGAYGNRGGRAQKQPGQAIEIDAQAFGASNQIGVQSVGGKTFFLQAGVWQDQSYDAKKQKITEIQAFSDAHFALMKLVPHLAEYSSVGEDVIVHFGANAIHIGAKGKEKLTEAEGKELVK